MVSYSGRDDDDQQSVSSVSLFNDHSGRPHKTDLISKRNRLVRLFHAAYCIHEGGFTPETCCPNYRCCCASKRLLEHSMACANRDCMVPGCSTSRRIWRHYRQCRHVHACPLCSAVPVPYSESRLAPRFRKSAQSTRSLVDAVSTGVLVGNERKRVQYKVDKENSHSFPDTNPTNKVGQKQSPSAAKVFGAHSQELPPLSPNRPSWTFF